MGADPCAVVLVPGGWHGGWTYDRVAERLRGRGHAVHAVTLAGLGSDASRETNLDTHVAEVVDVVRALDGRVVLAGHSYGGIVITGAADRLSDKVAHLIYVDAYVPSPGDSCWALTSDEYRALFVAGAAADGRTVAVPPGLDPRARPHPVACFLQALRLNGSGVLDGVPKSYVYGGDWHGTPFNEVAGRLRSDPAWTLHELPVGHDIMNRDPDGLAAILAQRASHP